MHCVANVGYIQYTCMTVLLAGWQAGRQHAPPMQPSSTLSPVACSLGCWACKAPCGLDSTAATQAGKPDLDINHSCHSMCCCLCLPAFEGASSSPRHSRKLKTARRKTSHQMMTRTVSQAVTLTVTWSTQMTMAQAGGARRAAAGLQQAARSRQAASRGSASGQQQLIAAVKGRLTATMGTKVRRKRRQQVPVKMSSRSPSSARSQLQQQPSSAAASRQASRKTAAAMRTLQAAVMQTSKSPARLQWLLAESSRRA